MARVVLVSVGCLEGKPLALRERHRLHIQNHFTPLELLEVLAVAGPPVAVVLVVAGARAVRLVELMQALVHQMQQQATHTAVAVAGLPTAATPQAKAATANLLWSGKSCVTKSTQPAK